MPFFVEDATGRVPVNPEGAEVDAEKVVDRFERKQGGGVTVSLGGLSVDLQGGGRTIGYRHVEEILPVDAPVYVLGVVGEDGGIRAPRPESHDQRFIISHRTEEALDQTWRTRGRWLGLGAGCAFVAGGFSALIGLLFVALFVFAGA